MVAMKKIFAIGLFCAVFIACNKEVPQQKAVSPHRIIKNKVLVILGEDYYKREKVLAYLNKNYVSDTDSKIELYTYGQMLTRSGNVLLRSIAEKIEASNCDIVVTLGAPEGTARYLMQMQAKYPEKVYISLLPMEDTLPLEAACDIVVDFKLPDTLMNDEETFTVSDEKVELLLVASVFAGEDILANDKKLSVSLYEEFNRAFFTAYSVLFSPNEKMPNFRISPYVDPDTSIPSRKYLIVCENADEQKRSTENGE